MIVDLPGTTTARIAKRLVELRDTGGAVALGRVLTLVVPTDDTRAEDAIAAANSASREHPCRIIVLARGERRGTSRLDGQVRVGGDAGASEVVVLRSYGPLSEHGASMVVPLLLPDAPVVTWWPGEAPTSPARDPLGALAQRRITDAAACDDPVATLARLGREHAPGDTDFAWSRLTLWRGLLATALDSDAVTVPAAAEISGATVSGAVDSPSTELLTAWLAWCLGVEVERVDTPRGSGIAGVVLHREGGDISLTRPSGSVAKLSQPGQPDRRIALPRRSQTECLSEELRRLDPDDVYGDVVTAGIPLFDRRAAGSASPSGAASA
ncbi:MAG: OpcA, an allosteric effector of glucose-6-phosphate dehydrogenase, actinobacterial [uncultured Quadrisphaera sp.]|uniref:OpcA, an allosteric effector of glucose-6-phosphate dehydrogenase, actinobacterial n=1 Tax=uncultured Quadrisphaera sp. TaxID=904978 RepID=A0A6J4Q8Z8_9ACTN|nr:MAG: OpcA, an allosteric effector of glucose-6-phosphate dehydrogenase, actinobacterial [uncultured Quadrisphaera sp.]